jgi:hypothetical protein
MSACLTCKGFMDLHNLNIVMTGCQLIGMNHCWKSIKGIKVKSLYQ